MVVDVNSDTKDALNVHPKLIISSQGTIITSTTSKQSALLVTPSSPPERA
jgi:hypothetical protein